MRLWCRLWTHFTGQSRPKSLTFFVKSKQQRLRNGTIRVKYLNFPWNSPESWREMATSSSTLTLFAGQNRPKFTEFFTWNRSYWSFRIGKNLDFPWNATSASALTHSELDFLSNRSKTHVHWLIWILCRIPGCLRGLHCSLKLANRPHLARFCTRRLSRELRWRGVFASNYVKLRRIWVLKTSNLFAMRTKTWVLRPQSVRDANDFRLLAKFRVQIRTYLGIPFPGRFVQTNGCAMIRTGFWVWINKMVY